MSRVLSKKESDTAQAELSQAFAGVDTSGLPDFHGLGTVLDQTLWILWASKDGLKTGRLTAAQIALLMRDAMEVSISASSVAQALRRAGRKVHVYRDSDAIYYEIMKAGKDHLLATVPADSVEMYYFEPGKKYSSKHVLSGEVIGTLAGDLMVVDPYCGPRTLDVLMSAKGNKVRVLTTLPQTSKTAVNAFKRELRDFASDYPSIEFRDYQGKDLHDRYILSPDRLVLLGYSIKDLGSRESFAIVLSRQMCEEIAQALSEAFEDRWQKSTPL